MSFIKSDKLVHEYEVRDEEGNVVRRTRALDGLNLCVEPGEFVAILGSNGSGKSTLARHINALLTPTGGSLLVDGMDVSDAGNHLAIRQKAGMIFQNPDNQLVAGVVEEDVAFGPENIGIPTEEIETRVKEALDAVGMTAYRFHSPNHLSGGQKQRIAIAGVMAMHPACIVFDESTAMLDPIGRREVLAAAHERNRRDGVTILWITHFMEEVLEADRVIVMDAGNIVLSGSPGEVFAREDALRQLGLELPPVTQLAKDLRAAGLMVSPVVLSRGQLVDDLLKSRTGPDRSVQKAEPTAEQPIRQKEDSEAEQAILQKADPVAEQPILQKDQAERILLAAEDVSYVYGANSPYESQALCHVDFSVRKGAFHALIGPTGSGKSTLVQVLGGLEGPTAGRILFDGADIYAQGYSRKAMRGRLGLLFQYPEYQLFETTVLKDAAFGPGNMGLSEEEALEKARQGLAAAGVGEDFWDQSPFDLSGGEKRRVAIAGVLAMEPEILIMDEPTAGLDPAGRRSLFALLSRLNRERGLTILLVSHNMEEVAAYADHITVLQKGRVRLDGSPGRVFRNLDVLEQMNLTLPEAAALARELAKGGLPVPEDVYTTEGLIKQLQLA